MMLRLAVLLVLLVARLAFAGPSTTFVWNEVVAFDGIDAAGIMNDTVHPWCTSWVPTEGITNATSVFAWITAAAGAGSVCSFSIYSAGGSTRIMTTGTVACDALGVWQATGLSAFSLTAGVKYQRCWCGTGIPDFLSYNLNSGADFGRTVRNTLSVPLRFNGSTSCTSGAAPTSLGSFSGGDVRPAFMIFGTSSP